MKPLKALLSHLLYQKKIKKKNKKQITLPSHPIVTPYPSLPPNFIKADTKKLSIVITHVETLTPRGSTSLPKPHRQSPNPKKTPQNLKTEYLKKEKKRVERCNVLHVKCVCDACNRL